MADVAVKTCASTPQQAAGCGTGLQQAVIGALNRKIWDQLSTEASLEESDAGNVGSDEIETQSDMWADSDYRKQLIRSLGAEVVATAFARAAS